MITSPKGVTEVVEHEGLVLGPYLDSVNIWTYGVGHTAAAGGLNPGRMPKVDTRKWAPDRVDEEILSALAQFDADLDQYEKRVRDAVKVTLKQHEFDALVSFDFNTGGIMRAKLTKSLNAGDTKAAARGFMGWLKPKEIIKRRTAEMNLFLSGNYDANGTDIPLYDALPDGRIRLRTVLDGKHVLKLMNRNNAKRPMYVSPFRGWLSSLFGRIFK